MVAAAARGRDAGAVGRAADPGLRSGDGAGGHRRATTRVACAYAALHMVAAAAGGRDASAVGVRAVIPSLRSSRSVRGQARAGDYI